MATPESSSTLAAWVQDLEAEDLQALVEAAAVRFPEVADWLEVQRSALSDDVTGLLAIVNRIMTPHRRFYDYRQANEYADDCYDTANLLADRALHASPELIPVIERAITLTTRAILKSDDSSGDQGELIHSLLQAHATAVCTSTPPLSQSEQTRVVRWMIKYRYSGTQSSFNPDIVAYAPGLSKKSIATYRRAIQATDLGKYGQYPLTRLAVLDRDRDAIVAANGGEPVHEMLAAQIARDLEEAGLHEDAVEYASRAVAMETRGWDRRMVDFLVDDAFARGDSERAVTLRREWFVRFPNSASFVPLRETAERAGVWARQRESAESLLAERDATGYTTHLLNEGRTDEAWQFATERVPRDRNSTLWLTLCDRRAQTAPSDALPVYRDIVSDTLAVTDQRNYRSAAAILKTMRKVAASAGRDAVAEFDAFLADTIDRNRRRPTCLEAFARAGLMSRQGE